MLGWSLICPLSTWQVRAGDRAVLLRLHLPPAQPQLPPAGAGRPPHLEEGGHLRGLVRGQGAQEVLLQGDTCHVSRVTCHVSRCAGAGVLPGAAVRRVRAVGVRVPRRRGAGRLRRAGGAGLRHAGHGAAAGAAGPRGGRPGAGVQPHHALHAVRGPGPRQDHRAHRPGLLPAGEAAAKLQSWVPASCVQEHSPKLGKPKKHPAYCVYVAYRLTARGSEPAGSSDLSSASTPFSGASGEEEEAEDDMEVAEELEDKQLSLRWPDRLSRGEAWLCITVFQVGAVGAGEQGVEGAARQAGPRPQLAGGEGGGAGAGHQAQHNG